MSAPMSEDEMRARVAEATQRAAQDEQDNGAELLRKAIEGEK